MKVLIFVMSFTFLLVWVNLGITAEDATLVAYYSFDGNSEDSSGNETMARLKVVLNGIKVNLEMQFTLM